MTYGTIYLIFSPNPLDLRQLSKVRSLKLDHWSHDQILNMLEGGNYQLHSFFARHCMVEDGLGKVEMLKKRYRTKASRYYRDGLQSHVQDVIKMGDYCGREASRSSSRRY
jgi:hypothetical protein